MLSHFPCIHSDPFILHVYLTLSFFLLSLPPPPPSLSLSLSLSPPSYVQFKEKVSRSGKVETVVSLASTGVKKWIHFHKSTTVKNLCSLCRELLDETLHPQLSSCAVDITCNYDYSTTVLPTPSCFSRLTRPRSRLFSLRGPPLPPPLPPPSSPHPHTTLPCCQLPPHPPHPPPHSPPSQPSPPIY